MNNRQIHAALNSCPATATIFGGVYPCDRLPKPQPLSKKSKTQIYIANTDPHDQPGQHWVALCISPYGSKEPNEFFCSYGQPPTDNEYFCNFLSRNNKQCIYNKNILQQPLSVVCGQYTMFYCWCKSHNYSLEEIVNFCGKEEISPLPPNDDYHRDNSCSGLVDAEAAAERDLFINTFVENHFDIDLQVYDTEYLSKQICTYFNSIN